MSQNIQINDKVNRITMNKKIERLQQILSESSEEAQPTKPQTKSRMSTKKFKTMMTSKLKKTNKLDTHVVQYCAHHIDSEIVKIEETLPVIITNVLKLFNITDPNETNETNETNEPNNTNNTNDFQENITHKLPIETSTNDPDALQCIGEQGIRGPRGVHGRDGKLLSTIDKDVGGRLHNINNKLDKIIEKIKSELNNNET